MQQEPATSGSPTRLASGSVRPEGVRESSEVSRSRSRRLRRIHMGATTLGTDSQRAASQEQAALFVAASTGDAAGVRRALARGADGGQVALGCCLCGLAEDRCICLGYAPLHCAAQAGCFDAVWALLEEGADPCVPSAKILFGLGQSRRPSFAGPSPFIVADGLTPLHVAAACGHKPIVELLLMFLADPHVGAAEPPKTALGLAVSLGEHEIVDLLRDATLARIHQRARESTSYAERFLERQDVSSPRTTSTRFEGVLQRVRAREQLQRQQQQQPAVAAGQPTGSEKEPHDPITAEGFRNLARRDGRGVGGVAASGGA